MFSLLLRTATSFPRLATTRPFVAPAACAALAASAEASDVGESSAQAFGCLYTALLRGKEDRRRSTGAPSRLLLPWILLAECGDAIVAGVYAEVPSD